MTIENYIKAVVEYIDRYEDIDELKLKDIDAAAEYITTHVQADYPVENDEDGDRLITAVYEVLKGLYKI